MNENMKSQNPAVLKLIEKQKELGIRYKNLINLNVNNEKIQEQINNCQKLIIDLEEIINTIKKLDAEKKYKKCC